MQILTQHNLFNYSLHSNHNQYNQKVEQIKLIVVWKLTVVKNSTIRIMCSTTSEHKAFCGSNCKHLLRQPPLQTY